MSSPFRRLNRAFASDAHALVVPGGIPAIPLAATAPAARIPFLVPAREPADRDAGRPGLASSGRSGFSYSAPLDGIRAIAIAAVLVFHVYPAALPGGFTGVDVFYVLSGFLITSIIAADLDQRRFSFREFYLRRIQRLAPNAILTVSTVVLLWQLLLLPTQATQAARHGVWTLFNLSNIFVWRTMGTYWGDTAEWAPLTHTWSLGIEEQFYLLYPGLLVLLARVQPRRVVWWLAVATAGSFAACVVGTLVHPVAAFYLLPTRLWELLLGGALALWQMSRRDRNPSRTPGPAIPPTGWRPVVRRWSGWVALGALIWTFIRVDGSFRFPGAIALLPTAATAAVIWSATGGVSALSRLLSNPAMVGVGKISYSLYLWHWPMITLGKMLARLQGWSPLSGAVAGGVASVFVSWTVYCVVERPLRDRGPGRWWRLGAIGTAFVVAAGLCLAGARRAPRFASTLPFERTTYYGHVYNAGTPDTTDPRRVARYADMYFPPLPPQTEGWWKTGGVQRLYGTPTPEVVVLGSSHALMHARLIDNLCREMSVSVAFLCADGTPAFFDAWLMSGNERESAGFNQERRRWLRTWHPRVVVVADRWDHQYTEGETYTHNLRRFFAELAPLCERIVVVNQPPLALLGESENMREALAWRMRHWHESEPRLELDPDDPTRVAANARLETVCREFPSTRVLRIDRLFLRTDGSIRYLDGRRFLYIDDDHLSDAGSELTRALFAGGLRDLGADSRSRPAAAAPPASP